MLEPRTGTPNMWRHHSLPREDPWVIPYLVCTQVPACSLLFSSHPILCGSFSQLCLYRSFQVVFSENHSTCRYIRHVFLMWEWAPCALLCHLDALLLNINILTPTVHWRSCPSVYQTLSASASTCITESHSIILSTPLCLSVWFPVHFWVIFFSPYNPLQFFS